MFEDCCNQFGESGYFTVNPARQTLAAWGYDRECYISTAKLASSAYTTQALIQAKLGGLLKLIEACDDEMPPLRELTGPVLANYNSILQNVTTEINGYLSSIYPIPLSQIGTVAVLRVSDVSTDGLGTITAIEVVEVGNYLSAPAATNSPAYLRHIDNLANVRYLGVDWANCQRGTGLELTVTYADSPFSDEDGNTVQAKVVSGVPVIVDGGLDYEVGQLLVLTGGTSFVPAKIRNIMSDLVCHSLYKRRLAPEEKNPFSAQASTWRQLLKDIGEGEAQLDGTYRRFFSAGAVWGQQSVLFGANSL